MLRGIFAADNGETTVNEAGLHHLEERLNPRGDAVCNIVAVIGPARTGKSTLLNMLAGEDSFATAHRVAPLTIGVDAVVAGENSHGLGGVVLMDCGGGDGGTLMDLPVAVTVLLMARAVLLNIVGMPHKHTLLEQLGDLAKAADHVRSDDAPQPFGTLFVVCRDLDANVAADIQHALLTPEDTRGALPSVRRRNALRQQVADCFAAVRVVCLPPASGRCHAGTVAVGAEAADFRTAVDALRAAIADVVAMPRQFGGGPLRCRDVCAVVRAVAEQVGSRSGGLVQPHVVMENVRAQVVPGGGDRVVVVPGDGGARSPPSGAPPPPPPPPDATTQPPPPSAASPRGIVMTPERVVGYSASGHPVTLGDHGGMFHNGADRKRKYHRCRHVRFFVDAEEVAPTVAEPEGVVGYSPTGLPVLCGPQGGYYHIAPGSGTHVSHKADSFSFFVDDVDEVDPDERRGAGVDYGAVVGHSPRGHPVYRGPHGGLFHVEAGSCRKVYHLPEHVRRV